MKNNEQFPNLLGQHLESDIIIKFFEKLSPAPIVIPPDPDLPYALHYKMHPYGVEFIFNEAGRLRTIFLFGKADGKVGFFAGNLPLGLVFSMSRLAVLETLGVPFESGKGRISVQKPFENWDKFDRGDYYIHLQYSSDDQQIKKVTLSTK